MRVQVYRVSVFGQPRGPWRVDKMQAHRDAIAAKLGSYDDTGRFYATVPGSIDMVEYDVPDRPSVALVPISAPDHTPDDREIGIITNHDRGMRRIA